MENGIKEKIIRVIETLNVLDDFILDDINGGHVSYKEFWDECLQTAICINQYIKCKTILAILDNSYELLKLYFAVMLTDKKIVAIDPVRGKAEIEEILSDVRDAILIRQEGEDVTANETGFHRVCIEQLQSRQSDGQKGCVIEKIKMLLENRDFHTEYLVTYTSGTSGRPKGVTHSLDNLFGAAFALQDKVCAPRGVFMHVMPMTYMAGILNSIFFPFITRNKILIMKRFSVKTAIDFWRKVSRYEADVFWLSPAMLIMIQNMDRSCLGQDYCRKHNVRFLIGTSHLAESTRSRFERKYGVKLQESYGLSETLFISVETQDSIKHREKDSAGELLAGVDYKILPDGELLVYVPWMYLGYTNEEDRDYFLGKYYKTGDLAEFRNGNLFITGRKKELIIKGGMNISPAQIEKCISQYKCVAECAVFGAGSSSGEEIVCCAYVVQKNDKSGKQRMKIEEELSEKVIDILGKNCRIDQFIYMDKLPKNANGKVDKEMLKSGWKEILADREAK